MSAKYKLVGLFHSSLAAGEGNYFSNQPGFLCSPAEQIILICRVKCGNSSVLGCLRQRRVESFDNQTSIFMLSLRNLSPSQSESIISLLVEKDFPPL